MTNVSKKVRQLSESEKSNIAEAFRLLDSDNDGFLDYHETKAAMRALGFEVKKAQVLSIVRMYDKSNGNKISYDDFFYIMSEKIAKRDPIEELKYAFKLFTMESKSGNITVQDLEKINQRIGFELTNEEMQSMIEEFDTDEDGSISESEFIRLMTETVI